MPMKNILRSVLGGIAAVVLSVAVHAANLAPGAFSAGTVKGDVTYKLAGTTQYMALTPGTALPQGATIKTGEGSLAVILFASGSTASIRPNSEVEISFQQEAFAGPLPKNAEPSVSNTQIKINDGQVLSKVSKLKKGSEFTVTTPAGAAGVRGTVFTVSYNAATGAFSVQTAEGAVAVTSSSNGTTTEVTAGTKTDGSGNVTALSAAEIQAINDAISAIENPGSSSNQGVSNPVSNSDGTTTVTVDTSTQGTGSPVSPN